MKSKAPKGRIIGGCWHIIFYRLVVLLYLKSEEFCEYKT